MLQDLRYAFRSMRHSPGFTAAGIATLGLAIAATTAVFSVVNAALLRPLPYGDPSRLVSMALLWPGATREGGVTLREAELWRRQAKSFSAVGSFVFTELARQSGIDVRFAGHRRRRSRAAPDAQHPLNAGREFRRQREHTAGPFRHRQ